MNKVLPLIVLNFSREQSHFQLDSKPRLNTKEQVRRGALPPLLEKRLSG